MKTTVLSVVLSLIGTIAGVLNFVPMSTQDHSRYAPAADAQQEQDLGVRCQAVATMHEQMMARMREADATVATLVEQMIESTGQKTVDAMAALLSELVAQRKAMHERMMPMHEQMMQHMMEHMAAAMPEATRNAMHESMQKCPMMKNMHGHGESGAHGDQENGG